MMSYVYWVLKDYRTPVPLLLTDGTHTRMVLALTWVPASYGLVIRDPGYNGTAILSFASGTMQPYVDRRDPSIVYTTPYVPTSQYYAMWPEISQGLSAISSASALEPYFSSWPNYSYDSWDFLHHSFPDRSVPDTLFMVGDTTRIWPLTYQAAFPIPSTLPINPGLYLQTAFFYQRNAAGQWSNSPSLGSSTFIDAQAGNPNPWFKQTLGMAINRQESADGIKLAWMGWRQIDVVKYALKVADMTDKSGVPVTFSITSPGGPTLPTNATYEWDFHDQSPLVKVSGPGPVIHTFTKNGTYAVGVKVFHGTQTAAMIAKAQATATIADSAIFYLPPDTVQAILGSPVTLTVKNKNAPTPKPIRYDWSLDHVVGAFIVSTNLTVEGDSVLQHTWNELGIFAARVTVRDSVSNKILGQDTVLVNVSMNAWKFTSINVQFTTVETIVGYAPQLDRAVGFTIWKRDSTMLVRLGSGQNEGGLLHLDKPQTFPFPPFAPFQANPGIYLLEGTNLTKARVSTHLDFQPIGLSGGPPAAGRITNHWLVFGNYQFQQGPTTDGNYLVGYTETGSLTNGSIAGTAWGAAQATIGNTGWFPFNVRQANVSFNGNTATGTLTYLFRVWQGGGQCLGAGATCKEAIRAVATLVFTAQRAQ